MARAQPPAPDKVRVLLTDPKLTPAELDRCGDLFMEADLPSVAAMFYDRTKSPDRVRQVFDRALKEGDAFLLEWVSRLQPDAATPEAWKRCGEAAEHAGKTAFARTA